jgi:signal transduction histidine kinase
VGTFLATLLVLYLLVRGLIIRPLTHLKDVSDRISAGDLTVRAKLRTGDEMESFAEVFNRMVEGLAESQRRLEDLNRSLDQKLVELGQANLKLFESNRLRSQFLANVSHELRTPLNAIIGFSEILSEQTGGPLGEKQARYVQNVLAAGRHLLRLINGLLDLARIESGKMEVNLARVSLGAVVENVVAMRQTSLKRDQTLTHDLADDLPPLLTDEGKLTQVLDNLVGNAVKFTDPGGGIDLTARRDGETVVIRVSDTGVGIAKEDQEYIFDKFRQVDASSTRRHAGAGLGLAIVKEFVTMLQGTVAVESAPGKGSTFTVRLPVESPPWKPPAEPGAEIG